MIKINDHTISAEEFDRACQEYQARVQRVDLSKEEYMIMANQLIDAHLFIEDATKVGLSVEDSEVEETINQVIAKYPNRETFEQVLDKMGDTVDSFCVKIKSDMLLRKYLQQSFYDKVEIDEEKVKGIYEANKDQFVTQEQVQASHILVKEKVDAEKMLQQIKDGGDFAALAKEHSTCPSGSKGGDLGLFKRGSMVKPFEDVAFELGVGETSGIVETQFGVHLIQVTDKKAGGAMPFEEAKGLIEQQMGQQILSESMGRKVELLRSGAVISIDESVIDKKFK